MAHFLQLPQTAWPRRRAAVIVAHPDDETLWCGGYVLTHPEFQWRIVTLCRGMDPDRAPRFQAVLRSFGAEGEMADLDDGPEQVPVPAGQVEEAAARLLTESAYEVILTHGPKGEYTQHRRHAECCRSVVALWCAGRIVSARLLLFAYEDGAGAYPPRVRVDAHLRIALSSEVWAEKGRLIADLYGFAAGSWEHRSLPREEGFWCFDSPGAAANYIASQVEQG